MRNRRLLPKSFLATKSLTNFVNKSKHNRSPELKFCVINMPRILDYCDEIWQDWSLAIAAGPQVANNEAKENDDMNVLCA